MALPIVAAMVGTAGVGAYLNAKYHITKDVHQMYVTQRGQWKFERAVQAKQINIYNSFLEQVHCMPNADCMWTLTRTYSWSQSNDMILRYAQWFLSRGIRRGDIVAFYLQNSAEFMFAWIALLAINAAPAMANFNLQGKALAHCVNVSRAVMVLTDEEIAERVISNEAVLKMGIEVVVLSMALKDDIEKLEAKEVDKRVADGTNEKSILALRYTSGTTGFPKAVRAPISRTYMLVYGKFSDMGLRNGPGGDRWYICMPMCHATAGSTVMACMIQGITLCIGRRFSTTHFWDEVRMSKATLFVYVGEVCRYLLNAPTSVLDKTHDIRLMYGNGLRPDIWRAFRERFGIAEIAELFGSTEGVITMVNQAKGDFLANSIGHHGWLQRRRYQNVYIPVDIDYEIGEVLRDSTTGFARRNPYNKGGEILVAVSSKSAFVGYHNNPQATEKRFLHDVFRNGDFYYRCGDALRRDDEGRWYFLDRLGDTFRWKSENVSTAEVSEVLGRFDGVIDANAYGVEVPGHEGRAGCAALLLRIAADRFDFQGLLRHCQRDLPDYAIPVFLRIVKEPSMNHTHKQSKTGLREDGIDLSKVGSDVMYFLRDGKYVLFEREQWVLLGAGKARL